MEQDDTFPKRLRWLAIATVCITAAATLTTGGGFLLTAPLILGVIAQQSSPRRGRWLIWAGAAFLSVTLLPMEVLIFSEILTELRTYHRLGGLGPILLPFWISSILLIIWCGGALLADGLKRRQNRIIPQTHLAAGDWIVWASAFLLSAYATVSIFFLARAYRHGFARGLDILLPSLGIFTIVALLDMVLLIDAATMRRPNAADDGNEQRTK